MWNVERTWKWLRRHVEKQAEIGETYWICYNLTRNHSDTSYTAIKPYIAPKFAGWRGTGQYNMMRDLLFYKHVIYKTYYLD